MLLILPMLAFLAGYFGTDFFFRWRKVPYPFELFGAAVGLGLSCFAMAFIHQFRKSGRN